MLTDLQFAQIMRNASQRRRALFLQPLNDAMEAHGITTPLRTAAFLAQLAHESGELQFMEEIWGPTAAQKRYEPPSDLARRLGNTQPGDGRRFKGRGPIQITGRANYKTFGDLMERDLVGNPEQAATPKSPLPSPGCSGSARGSTHWRTWATSPRSRGASMAGRTVRPSASASTRWPSRCWARARRRRAPAAPAKPAPGRAPTPSAIEALVRGPELIAADAQAQAAKDAKEDRQDQKRQGPAEESQGRGRAARVLDARPDTLDFRDLMYVPTLIEVPTHVPLGDYMDHGVPILDQGSEGACTGFGLATVANYLLLRRRVVPDNVPVSPRMFYELARRYDEWPGENYSGSSARGAMKGWHKHGVCSEAAFPYKPGEKERPARPHRRAHLRCPAPPAGRLLPGEPQRHRRHAFGTGRGRRAVRHLHRARGLERRRRRRCDHAVAHHHRRPRLRHRRVRRPGLLAAELVGRRLGPAGFCAHQLRRLAGERHRRLGGQARRAGHAAQAGVDRGGARRHVGAVECVFLRRPAPAHRQRRQQRHAQGRWRLRQHARRAGADLRAGHAARHAGLGHSRASCSTPTADWSASRPPRSAWPSTGPPCSAATSTRWPSSGAPTTGPPSPTSSRTR